GFFAIREYARLRSHGLGHVDRGTGISIFRDVLEVEPDWSDVVLSAISQLGREHVERTIESLIAIALGNEPDERDEALRILISNAGMAGYRALAHLVATEGVRLRSSLLTLLKDRGDAGLIAELMKTAAASKNVSAIESVLLVMTPS